MVNIGTPSRACKTCKQRRIKCDQTRPFCQRCSSSGRTCPGVPEEADILFRNQTLSTDRKSRNGHASRLSPGTSSQPIVVSFVTNVNLSPPLSKSASPRLHGRISSDPAKRPESSAVSSWFQSFDPSNGNDEIYANPCMEIVKDVFAAAKSNSPIYLALTANAMRAMSSSKTRRQMQSNAATLYGQALSMCKAAINDPKQLKNDETLLGSVVMSWYESQAICPASLESYNNHVRGTITLLRLRGRSQFSSKRSLRVFQAIRWQLILHCIQRAIPIDTKGPASFWTDERVRTNDVPGKLYSLAIQIPQLRARAEKLEDTIDDSIAHNEALGLRLQAADLDHELNSWFESLPAPYQYKTVILPQNRPTAIEQRPCWRGFMFQYDSYYRSMIVNHYRVMRLYLQSVISTCLEFSKYEMPTAHYESLALSLQYDIQRQVDDICATVPFHLGYGRDASSSSSSSSSAKKTASLSSEQFSLAGFYLMLPLCVCTYVDLIAETQRKWLRVRIAALAEIGYKQARPWFQNQYA